jgi:hypothetical protein
MLKRMILAKKKSIICVVSSGGKINKRSVASLLHPTLPSRDGYKGLRGIDPSATCKVQ